MAKNVSDSELLEKLLVCGSVSAAANDCGLSVSAVYKRLQNEDFRRKYDQLQGIILASVSAALSQSLTDAVSCLQKIVTDEDAPMGTKVSAADSLLRHCCRYIETSNILSRIERLENQTDYSV